VDEFPELPKIRREKLLAPALPKIGRHDAETARPEATTKLPAVSLGQQVQPHLPEIRPNRLPEVGSVQPGPLPPVTLGQQPGPFPADRPAPVLGNNLPMPPDSAGESLSALREMMSDDVDAEQERISQMKATHHRNRFAFDNVIRGSLNEEMEG
jgi:hypothetical protein